ncbi:MAG: hypothetical protein LBH20_04570 [Treponema sp.]|jgi:hypothetical protein|nr:hypothetical protein [Treponema sp.]
MAYIKTDWQARQGATLNKFTKSDETADSVVLVNAPDSITVPGTPFNPENMNHIEEGIAQAHEAVAAEATLRQQSDNNLSQSIASLTKNDIGLGNVTNDSQIKRSEMGIANGVATLNNEGKVPLDQLPEFMGGEGEGDSETLARAKEYTDTAVATESQARQQGDSETLVAAKAHADTKAPINTTLANPSLDNATPAAVSTPTLITSLLQTIWNKLRYLYSKPTMFSTLNTAVQATATLAPTGCDPDIKMLTIPRGVTKRYLHILTFYRTYGNSGNPDITGSFSTQLLLPASYSTKIQTIAAALAALRYVYGTTAIVYNVTGALHYRPQNKIYPAGRLHLEYTPVLVSMGTPPDMLSQDINLFDVEDVLVDLMA